MAKMTQKLTVLKYLQNFNTDSNSISYGGKVTVSIILEETDGIVETNCVLLRNDCRKDMGLFNKILKNVI